MKNYGVLKGRAKQFLRDSDSDPHSELLVDAAGVSYRIAINVRSSRGPTVQRLVEYVIVDELRSPVVDAATRLATGWTDLRDGVEDDAAIDYIRSNLFRAGDLKPLAHDQPGANNDLFEKVEALLARAIREEGATVYAFGEKWGPESKADEYFHFKPGDGVHDIHMNQGDPNEFNAIYQDGALLVHFSLSDATSGLFIKFQNQAWHTDELGGNPLDDAPTGEPVVVPGDREIPVWDPVPKSSPSRSAKIVAALINPRGDDVGKESVTVLNISDSSLDVNGWSILDRNDRAEPLTGVIAVGEMRTFRLSGRGAQMSNNGGTLTLLDAQGLKVDGVAYTKADASAQGAAIAF